jgi:hypothetical protein
MNKPLTTPGLIGICFATVVGSAMFTYRVGNVVKQLFPPTEVPQQVIQQQPQKQPEVVTIDPVSVEDKLLAKCQNLEAKAGAVIADVKLYREAYNTWWQCIAEHAKNHSK